MEVVKSAAFVRHLRATYSKQKADALLDYLKEKYGEYERHCRGVGFTGYSEILKVWNYSYREMTLQEMLDLMLQLDT